ncbi:MAG TPA: hypothetical protein VKE74_17430 [Gemmataceae bacterium]|nr:hypothetical protein [Gemmataceae bacterium]
MAHDIRSYARRTTFRLLLLGLFLVAWPIYCLLLTDSDLLSRIFRKSFWDQFSTHFLEDAFSLLTLGMLVTGIVLLLLAAAWVVHPAWHPLWRRLAAFNSTGDEIDAELDPPEAVATFGEPVRSFSVSMSTALHEPIRLTRNWLLQPGPFGLRIVPLADIEQMFKRRVKVYTNTIPTGVHYLLVVRDSKGRVLYFRQDESSIDHLMDALIRRCPHIDVGVFPTWFLFPWRLKW